MSSVAGRKPPVCLGYAALAAGRPGIERLAYAGHAPVLTAGQSAELVAELSGRLYLTAKAVCGFVTARFGLSYTPHAMAKLLGRLDFVWKRPKRIPAKANAAAQQAFLEQTLAPLMAQAAADPVARPLYFVDATHPAYDAHPACGWIRRGETRTLNSNHGRVNGKRPVTLLITHIFVPDGLLVMLSGR